ncbi:hypothetical protein SCHPADRAFT_995106 [Schizopora paradoxa]|uniref:Membrane insertase YidC/Oxa/ALB C-terminal domain-containing protein n=1 Tax=Schizopora paradoxa TaxID=27342 RepID=A0A0H2RY43_9AGAM|nr:hypothetical protein SCHPADRAFT_995106 [Schizopora paradoxa]
MSSTIVHCLRASQRTQARCLSKAGLPRRNFAGSSLTLLGRRNGGNSNLSSKTISGARHYSWWPSWGRTSPTDSTEAQTTTSAVEETHGAVVRSAEVPSTTPSLNEVAPVDSVTPLPPLPPADLPVVAEGTISAEPVSESILAAIPPQPLQYGDLAALDLVHYTPAGFFPWLLEVTQVSTGLPWWSVIIITTVGARIAVLPFVLRGMRASGRLAPIQPKLTELRQKMNEAKIKQDQLGFSVAVQKQHALMKEAGVNPFDTVLMSVVQLTVQFGFFIGLRRMCQLPVEQLKYGGWGFLTDLTLPDPYYITPIICTALVNLQLTLSGRDMAAVGSPATPHILNGFRVLSVFGVVFMSWLPSAINIHILTSILVVCAQTLILRNPAVRAKLSIPPLPAVKPGTKQPSMVDTWNYIKASFQQRQAIAVSEAAARQRKMTMMKK